MIRAWVSPALDVRCVPTGTTALQMYFNDFTAKGECGKTA